MALRVPCAASWVAITTAATLLFSTVIAMPDIVEITAEDLPTLSTDLFETLQTHMQLIAVAVSAPLIVTPHLRRRLDR